MAEDEFVQRAKKHDIAIGRPPTPTRDPTASSQMTHSPFPQSEKNGTSGTPPANSARPRQERPLAEPSAHPTLHRSVSDSSVKVFENDVFVDERAMEVQREVQRVRDVGEAQKQEYAFMMAQRTRYLHAAYAGRVRTSTPTAVHRDLIPRLNEQYTQYTQYPFSPTHISDGEKHSSGRERHHESDRIERVPRYTSTIAPPHELSNLSRARILTPIPDRLNPTALAFRPALKLDTAGPSDKANAETPTPATLDPTARSFTPPRHPTAKDPALAGTKAALDPQAPSFRPAPSLESGSHSSDEIGTGTRTSPSDPHAEGAVSESEVVGIVESAMRRHVGNPERVDWHGKAVLVRVGGRMYEARLRFLGLNDGSIERGGGRSEGRCSLP